MKWIDNTIYTLGVLLLGFILGFVLCDHSRVKAPEQAIEQSTTETWRITAYCPEKCCCGEYADGITSSGAPAKGKLIAAPKSIPFGTWIDIEGYGYAEVLDRGGAIKGRRLDVFFPTHQEALNWGVQYVEINYGM